MNIETTLPNEAIADIRAAKSIGERAFVREIESVAVGDCQNCGGSGIIWVEFTSKIPADGRSMMTVTLDGKRILVYSKTYPCPSCTDGSVAVRALYKRSGLELSDSDLRIDYIDTMDGKGFALLASRSILASLPRASGWYVFYGQYGRGKTGLLKAIVAQSILAGVQAYYCRAADILDAIRATYRENSTESETAIKARYTNIKILAVDEVNRIPSTDWASSALMSVLDTRYMRRAQTCTLFATNCEPDNMGDNFDYLSSRFQDGTLVPVGGDDLRGKNANIE